MKNRGFTLAEIMVTVGIIALLCAFAIPNFLRARCNSSETLALTSCQTIGKACQNFYAQINPHTYPANLAVLAGSTPSYIDAVLGGGQKQGYNFLYTFLDAERFQLQAQPITPGSTGNRFFFVDETGVLRVRMGAPAGPGDVPVE
ncbi:MAG: type II secretion system protein [Candidatus Omnitrophota bacterium]|nr:type II secretion system protein [Candidatus Omnitrophota bacterium]